MKIYKRTFLGMGLFFLAAGPGMLPGAKKDDASFSRKLSSDQKIAHALNRLTFGPRPGDFEHVRSMGLKKWIDLQLHPERIAENPALEAKLRVLDTLRMSTTELVENYPPPQLIRAMAMGRIPYPQDPERRKRFQRLAERYERRSEQQAQAEQPEARRQPAIAGMAPLANLLSPEERNAFRRSTPEERLKLFFSLPEEKQEDLVEVLPANMRRAVLARAPAGLRRKLLRSLAPQQVIVSDLVDSKLYRAIYSNRQLEEELVDFWFNHFNVFLNKGADRYLVTSYERDAIRPHVLGKFKDLLLATAQSPAMLFYLDNWQSVDPAAAERMLNGRRRPLAVPGALPRRGLNENYGRELLELHTMGVDGGYTQRDVIEVARCFTGWTISRPQLGGTFEFNERMHDRGEKTVLGVKIPAGGGLSDGLKVIDILASHPSTAHFISRKLAQRFVADNPPDSLVEKMARTYLKTGGDIREVMKTMLASGEFWSQGAYRAKVKSPLEIVVSAVRGLDAEVNFAAALDFQTAQLGEPLYRKQEPTGYSNVSRDWVNSAALLARMNFAEALTRNSLPGIRVDPNRVAQTAAAGPADLARKLLLADPSEATREAMTRSDTAAGGLQPLEVAGLVIGSPDFQRK